MSKVLEPAGLGVELSLSWLPTDFVASDMAGPFHLEAFMPLYDDKDWPMFKQKHAQQKYISRSFQIGQSRSNFQRAVSGLYIGRAEVDGDWRIGTVHWQYRSGASGEVQRLPTLLDGRQIKRAKVPPLFISNETGIRAICKYEILRPSFIGSFLGRPHRWHPWRGCNESPLGAVVAGCESDRPLYLARTVLNNRLLAGEFAPHRRSATFVCDPADTVQFDAQDDYTSEKLKPCQLVDNFEVLVLQERSVHPDIAKVFRI